jgi:hypothetical protein
MKISFLGSVGTNPKNPPLRSHDACYTCTFNLTAIIENQHCSVDHVTWRAVQVVVCWSFKNTIFHLNFFYFWPPVTAGNIFILSYFLVQAVAPYSTFGIIMNWQHWNCYEWTYLCYMSRKTYNYKFFKSLCIWETTLQPIQTTPLKSHDQHYTCVVRIMWPGGLSGLLFVDHSPGYPQQP